MWGVILVLLAAGPECQALVADGRAAYERRSYREAATLFERASAACGATEPILLALAQAQLLSPQLSDALGTLDRLLARSPENLTALKIKARALYLAGRDADAEKTIERAGALAPADDEIPYDLGRMYYQQKRHQAAAVQFRRAIQLNPRSHKAHDNLGLATEAIGDAEQALTHYLKAIELVHTDHPHYDVVYANLAELMLKLGRPQKAFDLAVEAAQRNSQEPRNGFLAGKALVGLERPDLSVRWLERAIALDAAYPEPRYLLAQVYRQLGRPADAERELKAFQEALARAPAVRR